MLRKLVSKSGAVGVVILILIVITSLGVSMQEILWIFAGTKDTTNLTNYGFAILVAIAAVCFSWSRTFNDSEKIWSEYIRENGERAVFGSLLFLIGSGIKYYIIIRYPTGFPITLFDRTTYIFLRIAYPVAFFSALFFFVMVLLGLMFFLWDKYGFSISKKRTGA